MKTLHVYGCSLTRGCEIVAPHQPTVDSQHQALTWGAVLAEKLNLKHNILAVDGSSVRDAAWVAVQNIIKHPKDIHCIGWTFAGRINYWYPQPARGQMIVSEGYCEDKDLDGHSVHQYPWIKRTYMQHADWREGIQNYLQCWSWTQHTAELHNTQLLHVQIGNTGLETQLGQDWVNWWCAPHEEWSNTPLANNSIYQHYQDTDVLFRDTGVYHIMRQQDWQSQQWFNNMHWNTAGHAWVAQQVFASLNDEQRSIAKPF